MSKLVDDWVYGGFLAALMLAISSIGLARYLPLPLLLVFLMMPAYMLHQAEEHFGNRLRDFLDREIGGGRSVLTNFDIFVVNVPGVWALFAFSMALAAAVDIGFGLVPAYAALLNVPAHVAPAIKMRRSNPGLVTAVLLLLPLSVWLIAAVSLKGVAWYWHVLALAVAIGAHGLILWHAARRLSPG
ncbi:HXXEE domain-containing protein [Devosia soli]|uniref:HXXEE domain-containing protein n=1 Tax=Devosia soli TaxID=361041 RepID=UPI00128E928A|nr:HXXEE domain-containing protein [Devosia soli]